MTNTIATVVETYLAAWNEPDPERRRALVGSAWTEDGTYLDPLMSGSGTEGIAEMIGAAQTQFPGHRFVLAAGPDAHNDVARFSWTLNGADGPVARGTDFAEVGVDGRLRSVTGFLDG